MNRIFRLYILFALFSTSGVFAFANQPASAPDNKPSIDTAAVLKERKELINKWAEKGYTQAVELYKDKKFAEAKKKFEEVARVIHDYKSVKDYLSRIEKIENKMKKDQEEQRPQQQRTATREISISIGRQ